MKAIDDLDMQVPAGGLKSNGNILSQGQITPKVLHSMPSVLWRGAFKAGVLNQGHEAPKQEVQYVILIFYTTYLVQYNVLLDNFLLFENFYVICDRV